MKIQWKRGSRFSIDPNTAYKALQKVRESSELTAGAVVLAAQEKKHPLHKAFEWDDSVAGEQWRLHTARTLIRSIEVIHDEAPNVATRAYEVTTQEAHLDHPERKVYRTVEEILRDPVSRDELLGNAIRDAIAFRRKYNALSELSKIFTSIDEFITTQKTS